MDSTPIHQLDVEVADSIGPNRRLRNPSPAGVLRVAIYQHVPCGCLQLRSGLSAYDCVGAGELDESQEELNAPTRRLAVSPPATESPVLSLQAVELLLLGIRPIREIYCGGFGH